MLKPAGHHPFSWGPGEQSRKGTQGSVGALQVAVPSPTPLRRLQPPASKALGVKVKA